MPFQIKDFPSIVASQINHARSVTSKVTDFQPGSVVRTLMEAPAVEVEELYMQIWLGLREAIPVATFLSFGFEKLPAALAQGIVTMTLEDAPTAAFVVPAGTSFSSSDLREYRSTVDVPWPAGETTIRVPVRSLVTGAAGNIAAGGISSTTLGDRPYIISNTAITTGRDVESDEEQQARFAEFIRSLSRGTMVACRFAVASAMILGDDGEIVEYVTRVGELEERGYVRFWIYSSLGTPSAQLLTQAQRALDGWRADDGTIVPGYRPAGVRVEALPMVDRPLSMGVEVSMYPGHTLDEPTRQEIANVYESVLLSVPAGEWMYLKSLIESMLAVPGVRSIVPDRSENIYCSPSETLVPGTLTITPA